MYLFERHNFTSTFFNNNKNDTMVQAIPICRLESFAVHFGDELRAGDHLR